MKKANNAPALKCIGLLFHKDSPSQVSAVDEEDQGFSSEDSYEEDVEVHSEYEETEEDDDSEYDSQDDMYGAYNGARIESIEEERSEHDQGDNDDSINKKNKKDNMYALNDSDSDRGTDYGK